MTTYNDLNTKLSGRNLNGRKIGNNTYAERREDAIAIRLHSTDILTFNKNGSTIANTGGWQTVTTKARLNEYLPFGYGISQRKGIWYWTQYNGSFVELGQFTEGDTIAPDGKLQLQAKPIDESKALKFRKRVNKYAKLCADSLPLEKPGAGDCFYCSMRDSINGQPLGDCVKDTDHLESHIDEGYVVPSLVYNAMVERGWSGKIPLAAAFGEFDGMLNCAKREVKSAVNRYIFKRYGMAYK